MHLEDFATKRVEIVAVCGKCTSTDYEPEWMGIDKLPFTEYFYRDETKKGKPWKSVRIYALTDNAWEHREGNHPNTVDGEKLGEHGVK
jgi:hypothetical protein